MARARNIKPSFFTNEQLSDNCPLGRLLFIGLWTLADYKGDLEWKDRTVKIQLLPWDDCDIKQLAINLDKSGLVRFYSDGIKTYLHVINFVKHQNPHKNEKEKGSDIPAYSESMRQVIDLNGVTINPDKSRLIPESSQSNPADSLLLIPSTLNPDLPESKEIVTPTATPKQRATRLPVDWLPDQTYWDAAVMISPELAPRLNDIAAKFKDYWISKSGKDATKADWLATWRNWIRREVENGKAGSGTNGKKSYGEQRSELFDSVTDYNKATNF